MDRQKRSEKGAVDPCHCLPDGRHSTAFELTRLLTVAPCQRMPTGAIRWQIRK